MDIQRWKETTQFNSLLDKLLNLSTKQSNIGVGWGSLRRSWRGDGRVVCGCVVTTWQEGAI